MDLLEVLEVQSLENFLESNAMQPIKQFQGQVPSAMNFPMEAYMAAMGSASKAMLAGSQAIGEGISQGVKAVGEAYGDYKKMESDVKASVSFAKSIGDMMPDNSPGKSQSWPRLTGSTLILICH